MSTATKRALVGRPQFTDEEREANFWSKVDRSGGPDACWPWLASVSGSLGYGQMGAGGSKMIRCHKYCWLRTRGPIPAGLCVLHNCDNPRCVNPRHLYLGTLKQNAQDRVKRGRSNPQRGRDHWTSREPDFITRGEACGATKITAQIVKQIRRLAGSCTQQQLAARFGISRPQISNIVNRKCWSHV